MGYVSKNIAQITEPKIITLAASPNFVQFASVPAAKTFFRYDIQVNILPTSGDVGTKTELRIVEPSGVLHTFRGTIDLDEVSGSTFFVAADQADTAENLRQALLDNDWIAANFYIRVPFVWINDTPTNGKVLNIQSKGTGEDFNIVISAPGNAGNVAYTLTAVSSSVNNDSISGEATTSEIELDIYTDPAATLGEDDKPTDTAKLGTFAISLQKTYSGVPVWFELNALFSHFASYNLPPSVVGWFDTGTARAYRFIAKKNDINSFPFYVSSALFVMNGYGRISENIDLNDYTYQDGIFKLLSNKPRTFYVRGQKEFLNFIYKKGVTDNAELRIAYRVYSTSNKYLGVVYGQAISETSLSLVNTCVLGIDTALDEYPNAGIIRVALARNTALLTNDLVYDIRPDCLHQLTQFVFLNRLGGWDTFNFDAAPQNEIKPKIETYNKTATPAYKLGDGVETVYSTDIEGTITIQGAPVRDDVAEWLYELAAARVILDGDGDYVVIDDFTLKTGDITQDMQVPTIKYHLSETFTND